MEREDPNKKTKRTVGLVMLAVVVVLLYLFVWPMLTQKTASAPANPNDGMPIPVAPASTSPAKASKPAKPGKKVALMNCPVTAKTDGDCPVAP